MVAESPTTMRTRVGDAWTRVREQSGTVRVRTTAAAVIVVGAALLLASVVMVILLRGALIADVRSAALLRAEAVADRVEAGEPEGLLAEGDEAEDEEFVQVLDPEGRVLASSPNLEEEEQQVVVRLAPGETRRIEGVPFEEEDPFLVVARSAESAGERSTVIVGRTLDTVADSIQIVIGLLAAGLPLLLLIIGVVAWRIVGRALEPVEAIRSEVEAISTKELHRRVPHPPGRDEIARLAAMMNRMLARLEKGQARQRRFVSDASHEMRSPVTTIRQHAEVALAHPDGATTQELAEVVLDENLRLQRLVDDLLLLSKMDEPGARSPTSVVDLDDLVFEEAERMRATTTLRIDTSGVSAGRVSGDKGQLARLIRNLCDNALRHAGGVVRLTLKEDATAIVLMVDDDGEGIPPSERERIFERFVRLDEARDRDSGGSGLGLAIVAEIAVAHGATVGVLDGASGGARFEVRFPLPQP
jgi:signal transduction histidine kinase